jgi:hypothetical protein
MNGPIGSIGEERIEENTDLKLPHPLHLTEAELLSVRYFHTY